MSESKSHAKQRAKKEGFKQSSVVKSDKSGYFIAPNGIKSESAKKAYANCRSDNNSKEKCAKISWTIQNKKKK